MTGSIKYPRTTRTDNICNLCQKTVKKLSDDHVPPKGGYPISQVIIQSYPEGTKEDTFRLHHSSNGLKFKTICSECNNLLGAKFDEALNEFVNNVAKIASSPYNVLESFSVEVNPTRVIKAVLAHLLAAKTGECNTTYDKKIRQYIFDDGAKLPSEFKLYYWYYPYDTVVISLDKFAYDMESGSSAFFSVLKYYPIAFLLLCDTTMADKTFCELTKYNHNRMDERVRIPFNFKKRPGNFPESIQHTSCCLVPEDHTDLISYKVK